MLSNEIYASALGTVTSQDALPGNTGGLEFESGSVGVGCWVEYDTFAVNSFQLIRDKYIKNHKMTLTIYFKTQKLSLEINGIPIRTTLNFLE